MFWISAIAKGSDNELYTRRSTSLGGERSKPSNVSRFTRVKNSDVLLKLTIIRLDDILAAQEPLSEWPAIGRYLLYITSCEAVEYWRPYIGQGFCRELQHIAKVLSGSLHTQVVDNGIWRVEYPLVVLSSTTYVYSMINPPRCSCETIFSYSGL